MRIERSFDFDLIWRCVTDPRGYDAARDDFSPDSEKYEVSRSREIWYLTVHDAGELLGVFAFVPENGVCYQGHCCLLPCARGRGAEALRESIAFMFRESPARRIVGSTPEYLRLAVKMARDAGLEQYGFNPRSFQRGGRLYGQVLMGISKGASV